MKNFKLYFENDFMSGIDEYESRAAMENAFKNADYHVELEHDGIEYDVGVSLVISRDHVIGHEYSKERQAGRDVYADIATEVKEVYAKGPDGEFVTDPEIIDQLGGKAIDSYNSTANEYKEYGDWH